MADILYISKLRMRPSITYIYPPLFRKLLGNASLLIAALLLQNSCGFCPILEDGVSITSLKISPRTCYFSRPRTLNCRSIPNYAISRHSGVKIRSIVAKDIQYFAGSDFDIDWQSPIAKGNFGSVYYGAYRKNGLLCAIKCPNLEEFSLRCYRTEVR